MNPRTALAGAIRALNARIAALTPEAQREIQPDWRALQDQLDQAPTDDATLAAVDDWQRHWVERLS